MNSITEPEKLDSLRNFEAEEAKSRIMQIILSGPPAGPMPVEPPLPPRPTTSQPAIPFNPYPDAPLHKLAAVPVDVPAQPSASAALLQIIESQKSLIDRLEREIARLTRKRR